MNRFTRLAALVCVASLLAGPGWAEETWLERSNAHAMKALELQTKYGPEFAAQMGVEGYDAPVAVSVLDHAKLDKRLAAAKAQDRGLAATT